MACCCTWGPAATLLLLAFTSQISHLPQARRCQTIANRKGYPGNRGAEGAVRAEGKGKAVGEAAAEKGANCRDKFPVHGRRAYMPRGSKLYKEGKEEAVPLVDNGQTISGQWTISRQSEEAVPLVGSASESEERVSVSEEAVPLVASASESDERASIPGSSSEGSPVSLSTEPVTLPEAVHLVASTSESEERASSSEEAVSPRSGQWTISRQSEEAVPLVASASESEERASAPDESSSESEEEDDIIVILEDHTDVIGPSWRANLRRSEPSEGQKAADFEKLQLLDPVDEGSKRYTGKVKTIVDYKFGFIHCEEIYGIFHRDTFIPPPAISGLHVGAMVTFRVFLVRGQPQADEIRPASPAPSSWQAADLSVSEQTEAEELFAEDEELLRKQEILQKAAKEAPAKDEATEETPATKNAAHEAATALVVAISRMSAADTEEAAAISRMSAAIKRDAEEAAAKKEHDPDEAAWSRREEAAWEAAIKKHDADKAAAKKLAAEETAAAQEPAAQEHAATSASHSQAVRAPAADTEKVPHGEAGLPASAPAVLGNGFTLKGERVPIPGRAAVHDGSTVYGPAPALERVSSSSSQRLQRIKGTWRLKDVEKRIQIDKETAPVGIFPPGLGVGSEVADPKVQALQRRMATLQTAPVEPELTKGDGLDVSKVSDAEAQALQRRTAILALCNNRIHISRQPGSTKPFTLGALRAAEEVIRKSLGRIHHSRQVRGQVVASPGAVRNEQNENDPNLLHLKGIITTWRELLPTSRIVLQAQLPKHKVARALLDACSAMFFENMSKQRLHTLIKRYDELIVILTENVE